VISSSETIDETVVPSSVRFLVARLIIEVRTIDAIDRSALFVYFRGFSQVSWPFRERLFP
jgi:hypothetical protein